MAAPTNTFISNSAVGNRESLHNIITVLNKDETPFISTIGSGDADATYEEWQLDALGNADTNNSNLEGDDTTAAAITPTVRVGNRTQILKKPFTISNTQEAVKKAGRDSEISYQTALAGRRAKMDLEAIVCQNQASVAQSGAVTRKLGGFESLAHQQRLARRRRRLGRLHRGQHRGADRRHAARLDRGAAEDRHPRGVDRRRQAHASC